MTVDERRGALELSDPYRVVIEPADLPTSSAGPGPCSVAGVSLLAGGSPASSSRSSGT